MLAKRTIPCLDVTGGRVVPLETTRSEVDGADCVYIERAEYRRVGSGVPLLREVEHRAVTHAFLLEDDTGQVLVDPGRALIECARLSEDRLRYEDEGIDRSYLEGGVDVVGPSFSRVFNRPLGPWLRFKHLIEPRLEYSYVSDVGDTSLIPRFDEVDSTLVTNRVRA